jgi:hypothetical protein
MLATAAVVSTLAVTAQAAPVCHGQLAPKPADPQAELRAYAAQRAELGFRHDLKYVKLLIKRGVREYDVGDIPVTHAENRYLKLRDDLTLGAKGNRFMHDHRAVAGGVEVEDDWPHEPYLEVGFTRDVRQNLRQLQAVARYPRNLRAKRVPYSAHALTHVANSVWKDAKRLRAAGFILTSSGVGAFTADVDVITERTDARSYFRKRYGKALKVSVIAKQETELECAASGTYSIAPDGNSITVYWTTGGGAKTERVELTERADQVEVGVVERVPNGPRTLEAIGAEQTVALSAPLGDRPVYDAATGLRMLQRGPSPGEPPCPVSQQPSNLDVWIATRAHQGLRHDAPYVETLLRRHTPYTKAEQAWIDRREKLDEQQRISRYLDAHHDESADWTVAGSYPQAPYVLVRVTKRAAYHRAQLRKVFKGPLKVVTVAHTLQELTALRNRIETDANAAGGFFDGFGDAGFQYIDASVDEDANDVRIDVITPRADAIAYFQARYGPLVQVQLRGTRYVCGPQPVAPVT